MIEIGFKCKLLTNIILSQKSATEGSQVTLDFIPGTVFLGISASSLYKELDSVSSYKIFHTISVRFGDAHIYNEQTNLKSFKIPLTFFQDKYNPGEIYLWSKIRNKSDIQAKQMREGFYFFDDINNTAVKSDIKKNFSIKSAYDPERRRSKDEAMFGYEALIKNSVWQFTVIIDDEVISEEYIKLIVKSLCGIKKIGRSRSAQYGLVEISQLNYEQFENSVSEDDNSILLYAESRVVFKDVNGLPKFLPDLEEIGINGYKICLEDTQIRTFQYAPFNSTRRTREGDRIGIEKGSVICIIKDSKSKSHSSLENTLFVGFHQNEGFGKILVNPPFLNRISGDSPSYNFTIDTRYTTLPILASDNSSRTTKLLTHLNKLKDNFNVITTSNIISDNFINTRFKLFKSSTYASQWGSIRKITIESENLEVLKYNLLDESNGFLKNGVAKDQWSKGNRLKIITDLLTDLDEKNYKYVMINIASEIAKKIQR